MAWKWPLALLLVAILALFGCGEAKRETTPVAVLPSGPPDASEWQPLPELWDEFGGPNLDTSRWYCESGLSEHAGMEARSPRNVALGDGRLRLTMGRTAPQFPAEPRSRWTTGAIRSRLGVLYGFLEVKCKAAPGRGASALDLVETQTDRGAEIAAFEIVPGAPSQEHTVRTNLKVFRTPDEGRIDKQEPATWKAPFDPVADYHRYAVEWNEQTITFYVDGAVRRTVPNTHWHQPMILRLRLEAIPERYGPPDEAALPATFQIEYVRAWQRKGEGPAHLLNFLQGAFCADPTGPLTETVLSGGTRALTAVFRRTSWDWSRLEGQTGITEEGREVLSWPDSRRLERMDRIDDHTQVWLVPLADHPNAGADLKAAFPPLAAPHQFHRETAFLGRGRGFAWYMYGPIYEWIEFQQALRLEGGDDPLRAALRGSAIEDKGNCTRNGCECLLGAEGPRAIPYIEKALAAEHPSQYRLVGQLSQSPDLRVTAWLMAQTSSSNGQLAQAARSALIWSPRPQAANLYVRWLEERIGQDPRPWGNETVTHLMGACEVVAASDLVRLLPRIMQHPTSIREYRYAFETARRLAGKPIPAAMEAAERTILDAAWGRAAATDSQIDQAVRILAGPDDPEAAAIMGLCLAITGNKCNTELLHSAGLAILRQLPGGHVRRLVTHLAQTHKPGEDIRPVAEALGISLP